MYIQILIIDVILYMWLFMAKMKHKSILFITNTILHQQFDII